MILQLQNNQSNWIGGVAQVVELLHCKHKALSTNCSLNKRKQTSNKQKGYKSSTKKLLDNINNLTKVRGYKINIKNQ
jgi:hypothetical protein